MSHLNIAKYYILFLFGELTRKPNSCNPEAQAFPVTVRGKCLKCYLAQMVPKLAEYMTKGKECCTQRMKNASSLRRTAMSWANCQTDFGSMTDREKKNKQRESGSDNAHTLARSGSFRRACPERAGSSVISSIFITVICYWRKCQTGSSPSPHAFTCQRKIRQRWQEAPPPWSTDAHSLSLSQGRKNKHAVSLSHSRQTKAKQERIIRTFWSNERTGATCQSKFVCEVERGSVCYSSHCLTLSQRADLIRAAVSDVTRSFVSSCRSLSVCCVMCWCSQQHQRLQCRAPGLKGK